MGEEDADDDGIPSFILWIVACHFEFVVLINFFGLPPPAAVARISYKSILLALLFVAFVQSPNISRIAGYVLSIILVQD